MCPKFFKPFHCKGEKSMAKSQSATKCVRCVPFIINVTTLRVTATVKTSKWLPWRCVTQDAAKNIPLLSYHDKYFIIWRLTMMVSNAISQQVSSCEHYGYLMDCLMVTLNVPFVKAQCSLPPRLNGFIVPWWNVRRQLLIWLGKSIALSSWVHFTSRCGFWTHSSEGNRS